MLSKNQIKEIQSLQLKKTRDSRKLFLVEGIKTITELIATQPQLVEGLFALPDFIRLHEAALHSHAIKYTAISEEDLGRISLQQTPNKAIAVCHYLPQAAATFDFKKHFSLYLDDIRDPGNFGTLLRLADWYGISTLFCSPASCDIYNPKVIQASMGAFLRVAVVYTELDALRARIPVSTTYGAVLTGEDLYKAPLQNGLIVIGNEANGIRESTLEQLDRRITIPAHKGSGTESLNAAIAASIIVSEFFRRLSGTS